MLHVTVSGKPTQRPLSWHGWKTRDWVTRLSGTIFQPSAVSHGVSLWTSYLRDTRANHSAAPEKVLEQRILATFGRTWIELLARSNPGSCSWRTSQGTFALDSEQSSELSKQEATGLQQDCLRRQRSAPATSGSDCSFWPSARAEDSECVGMRRSRGIADTLTAKVSSWMTPTAKNAQGNGYTRDKGAAGQERLTLTGESERWATPRASETPKKNSGDNHATVSHQAQHWPTPKASHGGANSQRSGRAAGGPDLEELALDWPTPTTHDHKGAYQPHQRRRQLDNMAEQVWMTPQASDSKVTGLEHQNSLAKQCRFSRPDQPTTPVGPISSSRNGDSRPLSPRPMLNPFFVEHLMGLPLCWTIAATGFGLQATALSLWRQRMLSSLWRLACSAPGRI